MQQIISFCFTRRYFNTYWECNQFITHFVTTGCSFQVILVDFLLACTSFYPYLFNHIEKYCFYFNVPWRCLRLDCSPAWGSQTLHFICSSILHYWFCQKIHYIRINISDDLAQHTVNNWSGQLKCFWMHTLVLFSNPFGNGQLF